MIQFFFSIFVVHDRIFFFSLSLMFGQMAKSSIDHLLGLFIGLSHIVQTRRHGSEFGLTTRFSSPFPCV